MNVYSTSAENYATVQLEFEDGTDMDSAMVKVSSAVQQVAASLPDMAGTPSIMELSADMMATMYVAVSRDGYDIYELSDYVDREVVPYVSRQSGVASVSTIGLVEKSVQVELNAGRIDDLNDKLLVKVNDSLAEAKAELTKAENQVADGKKELEKQQASFGTTMSGQLVGAVEGSVLEMAENLRKVIADILPEVKKLQEQQNQQQQNQDNDQNQNQDQNQDDQNKDDQNQNDDQDKKDDRNDDKKDDQQDQNNDQDQHKDQQKPQQSQGEQPKITPQAAQQMLQAIQAKEKETQDKVNKEKADALKARQKDKNW
jgi:hypothetical protein